MAEQRHGADNPDATMRHPRDVRRPGSPISTRTGMLLSTGNERESLTSDHHARLGSHHLKGFDSRQQSSRVSKNPSRAHSSWAPEKQRSPYGAVPAKGEAVAVVGLRKLPEYNGRVGIVKTVPLNNFIRGRTSLRRKPRYAIFLPGWSQLLNIRMENLCVLDRHKIPVVVQNGHAGLGFHKDDCGWLVISVSQTPPQTHIRKRDIIVAVDGKSLMCRSAREQTRIVNMHLRDGVSVDVLRTPSRNRSRRERARSDGGRNKRSAGSTEEEPRRTRRRLTERTRALVAENFQTLEAKGEQAKSEAASMDVAHQLFIDVLATLRSYKFPGSGKSQIQAWAEGRASQIASELGLRLGSEGLKNMDAMAKSAGDGASQESGIRRGCLDKGEFMALFEGLEEGRFDDKELQRALLVVLNQRNTARYSYDGDR